MYSILIRDKGGDSWRYYTKGSSVWTADTTSAVAKELASLLKVYTSTLLKVVHNCTIDYESITVADVTA